jgi:hypothetical protein
LFIYALSTNRGFTNQVEDERIITNILNEGNSVLTSLHGIQIGIPDYKLVSLLISSSILPGENILKHSVC